MYLFLALSSGVLWGVWGFGYGRYGRVMSRYSVILTSASGAALVFLITGLVRHDIKIDPIDLRDGLLGGILNLLGSVLLLKAVTMGKIGTASGVNASYVLIPLGYALIIGETISAQEIAGGLVIIIGLAIFFLLKHSDSGHSSRPLASVGLAFVSAIFYGAAVVVLDFGTRDNLYGTMFLGQLPCIAISLVMLTRARSFGELRTRHFPPLLGTGFALGLAGIAFYTAADYGDLGIASVLSSISPVATAVLAFLILKEKMIRTEITALAVVLSGVALTFI
ncbi:MAG: DMT family transporter [Actinomycetota bacterium]